MIYNRRFAVPVSSVIEVFDEIGISPGRYEVAIQVLGGNNLQLVEDGTGANPGPNIWVSGLALYRLISNKDPIYIKNSDSTDQAILAVSLTAVP